MGGVRSTTGRIIIENDNVGRVSGRRIVASCRRPFAEGRSAGRSVVGGGKATRRRSRWRWVRVGWAFVVVMDRGVGHPSGMYQPPGAAQGTVEVARNVAGRGCGLA